MKIPQCLIQYNIKKIEIKSFLLLTFVNINKNFVDETAVKDGLLHDN